MLFHPVFICISLLEMHHFHANSYLSFEIGSSGISRSRVRIVDHPDSFYHTRRRIAFKSEKWQFDIFVFDGTTSFVITTCLAIVRSWQCSNNDTLCNSRSINRQEYWQIWRSAVHYWLSTASSLQKLEHLKQRNCQIQATSLRGPSATTVNKHNQSFSRIAGGVTTDRPETT